MDVTYNDLVELVAQREMGILGPNKTFNTFQEAGIDITPDGKVNDDNLDIKSLEAVAEKLHEKFGPVAIMGCKIVVNRLARQGGLELPKILKL